ncbi:DNA gyrase subunit A [Varunaivibrio sulfuroxidans]|nr:DNA gyrase subunit A [Varunaivibrio sulfuroxidans]WES32250.1 DNA gyrase subunit A [Varunaivibrio sulfuroxidans]
MPPISDSPIATIAIEDEMQTSYLDYAMSVIVSRALPDVRDGLKPVHRRIIHSMNESGFDATKPFRKSARIVGDVMGKYHPHGDSAIYDAMVRMAQNFSMRLPLIDGQGNFGSMDGDRAAAMRYTEARMAHSAHALVADIDKDTVDFRANYDESAHEPTVLPARFPNLLVNGAGGIAVGMATNIPPHNLGEVIDACMALIDDPDLSIDALTAYVQGPDFPTGASILGRQGIYSAYHTGRGSVIMRGRATIEEIRKDREAVVITEIPYQVNKSRMVEIMAECVRDKRIEGISDIRDESDRHGVRVVVEVKRDAMAEIVLNQLYRYTPLQTSFGINMLALNGGRPQLMNLKDVLQAFVDFREEVIRRRTIFLLSKARDRAHVLVGLGIAVANIDEVIALIRKAPDSTIAREQLMARSWPASDVAPLIALIDEPGRQVEDGGVYWLSEVQAKAILELRLQRLTGLERDKIAGDLRDLGAEIESYLEILDSPGRLRDVMREELLEMRDKFATPRRTALEDSEFEHDIEDLIQREDMVVTVTNTGYVKRVPLSTYRAQRRGGKGRSGMSTRDEDFVNKVFVVNTHTPVLFFSSNGMVYKMKVYKLPLGSPQARGQAIINLLPLDKGETITTLMPLPEDESTWSDMFVMFATASGGVRRNRLSDFVNVKSNGKIAMKLDEGEQLVGVKVCGEDDDILLAAQGGKCIRFPVTAVRVFASRASSGVRGMRLGAKDRVISMSILRHVDFDTDERDAYLKISNAQRRAENGGNGGEDDGESVAPDFAQSLLSAERFDEMARDEQFLLSITQNGYGKRTSAYEYRIAGRGGQGITNIETSSRNGPVAASFPVEATDHVMMVTDGGKLIRTGVAEVRIAGRNTQGVTLFKIAKGEKVVSVTRLHEDEDEDDGAEETGGDAPSTEAGNEDAGTPSDGSPGDGISSE